MAVYIGQRIKIDHSPCDGINETLGNYVAWDTTGLSSVCIYSDRYARGVAHEGHIQRMSRSAEVRVEDEVSR